jgi:formate/nitrite transporter FocA (FNT family)
MRDNLITLIKAWLAGICISIGCNVYLTCENKYIGATLFSVGLITILLFGFNLYTGKIGYVLDNAPNYIKQLAIILCGNLAGCLCVGAVFPSEIAQVICENKLQISLLTVLFKAIMCGILMFIAVDAYKQHKILLPAVFCVATFILSGYEHSIADMAYFVMGRVLTFEALLFIATVIIGNTIGGIIIPLCNKIMTKLTKQND